MSARLFLYDAPEDAARFLPFSVSRPIGELRHGAFLIRERWAAALGRPVAGHLSAPFLAGFVEPPAPPVVPAPGETGEARLVVRSTFVPDPGTPLEVPDGPARLVDGAGETVGAALPSGTPWRGIAESAGWPALALPGTRLLGVWQLVGDLATALSRDLERLRAGQEGASIPRGVTVLGDPSGVMAADAMVEPSVIFDVRAGPIFLGPRVEVRALTRLAGPLIVHEGTRLVGGQIRDSAIGPRCVVHGEVSSSVFLGYANKSHDGFLGHSVVGRWVNLGAGTITSNLKNTYGPVRLDLGGVRTETGLMFLGSLIGDHAKTAIGTMLPTGCVIGTGANVFGSRRPEAHVPAFAWGTEEPGRLVACRLFLEVAGRVMPRRGVEVNEAIRRYLAAVWEAATGKACD